jgi:hypothetical protein
MNGLAGHYGIASHIWLWQGNILNLVRLPGPPGFARIFLVLPLPAQIFRVLSHFSSIEDGAGLVMGALSSG